MSYQCNGFYALLPLLEALDALNVFIYDFIAALERCHGHIFTMYQNQDTRFRRDDFHAFNMLLALNHESIPMKWDANLNLLHEVLAFVFGDHQLPALYKGRDVTRESLANIVEDIKSQCSDMYAEFFLSFNFFFNKHRHSLFQ